MLTLDTNKTRVWKTFQNVKNTTGVDTHKIHSFKGFPSTIKKKKLEIHLDCRFTATTVFRDITESNFLTLTMRLRDFC